jgi:hypothetical protein
VIYESTPFEAVGSQLDEQLEEWLTPAGAQARSGEDRRLDRRHGAGRRRRGGEVVVRAMPEQIARKPESYTGQRLKPVLARTGASRGAYLSK